MYKTYVNMYSLLHVYVPGMYALPSCCRVPLDHNSILLPAGGGV